jgi:hypothetical protein
MEKENFNTDVYDISRDKQSNTERNNNKWVRQ